MATVGSVALTFTDLRKRLGPDNKLDQIMEIMLENNPIMQDIPWMEGNLPTGNLTTIRTAYPHPTLRRINRGVKATKSATNQITDTCCILEDRSSVDIKLLSMAPDKQAFRLSEDKAHVIGFTETIADYLFYGDTESNPDEFNGLSVRLNSFSTTKGEYGYQCVNAGGNTADKQTTAYIVDWGDDAVVGIYPKGSTAGLDQRDLGESDAIDANGGKYRVLETLFTWDAGLAVRNLRKVAALRNIDMSRDVSALTSAEKKALVDKMIVAKNRISVPKNPVMYISDDLYTMMELFYNDKNNVHITRQELLGKQPQLYVNGVRLSKNDAVLNTEPVIG